MSSGKIVDMFLCPRATCLNLFQIISLKLTGRAPSRKEGGAYRAQSLGLLETRTVFRCLSHEGEAPVQFPGKVYEMAVP